jgi:hypothetical protein
VKSAVFDALLTEIAERVADIVVARLAAPSTHYGTGKAATLPPGKSRAWALRNVKRIPGARKIGRDWIVSVADFDAWMTDRDSERCRNSARPANDVAPPIHPAFEMAVSGEDRAARAARSLAAQGFRRTR